MKASIAQYAKTLLEITDGKTEKEISGVVARFAENIKKGGELKNAGKMIEKFTELYNKKHGIIEATVVTRCKMQDTRYKDIEDFIKKKYEAKEVVLKNVVDENIKGGIVIRVGDEILDSSISSQLKRLRSALIK